MNPESNSKFCASGWRLQHFGKGRSAIQSKHANELVDCLNALGNITIQSGTENSIVYSDSNVVITVSGSPADETTASGTLQAYVVKSAPTLSNYLVCRTWDGSLQGGSDVIIAKPFDARQPASQTLGGVLYTYTYGEATLDEYNDYRESDDGSTVEVQLVTPVYYENCLIIAAQVTWSGVTYSGSDLKIMEISPRCWAKAEPPPT